MARIRSIKPEFFTSGTIVECSTNARLLFVGIWVFADDAGRHKLDYRSLKMEIFPGDPFSPADVEAMFAELWRVGLVSVYDGEECRFFVVNGWHHQKIDRPQPARFPNPLECALVEYGANDPRSFDAHSTNDRRAFATDTIRSGYDTIGSDRIGEQIQKPNRAVPGRRFASQESTASIGNRAALAAIEITPLPRGTITNGQALKSIPDDVSDLGAVAEWWRRHLSSDAPLTGGSALDLLQVLCLATEATRAGGRIKNKAAWFAKRLADGVWLGSSTSVDKIRDWLNDEINAGRIKITKQPQEQPA